MKAKSKYVVVFGTFDKKTEALGFISTLGAYDNSKEAYGAAYLYLNDEIESQKREGDVITPLYDLVGETGFGMEIISKDENRDTDFAFVLFDDTNQE